MKRIFTIIALAVCSMTVMATDYVNTLTVNLNGVDSTPQTAVISVDKQDDGKYTLQLKNFILTMPQADPMPVGNITLTDVEGTVVDGVTKLVSSQNAALTPGDLDGVTFWLAMMMPYAPVELTAEINGDNLTASIDIDMTTAGSGVIKVTFGDTDTAISTVKGSAKAEVEAVYDLTGRRVSTMTAGKVYIVKYTDGKAVKTIMR